MTGDLLVEVAGCDITRDKLDRPLRTCRNGHQRTSFIPAVPAGTEYEDGGEERCR